MRIEIQTAGRCCKQLNSRRRGTRDVFKKQRGLYSLIQIIIKRETRPQLRGESLKFCQNTFPFAVLVKHERGAKEWEDCLPNWHEVPRDPPNSFKAFHVTFITNVNRHVAEYETQPSLDIDSFLYISYIRIHTCCACCTRSKWENYVQHEA